MSFVPNAFFKGFIATLSVSTIGYWIFRPKTTKALEATGQTQQSDPNFISTKRLHISKNPNAKPVVIVACGAFSPPTFLHLRLFESAKDYLTDKGWEVIGGYLSPVSDGYGKKGLVAAPHRVAMCHAAVAESDWIDVDEWESSIPTWTRTRVVLENFLKRLNTKEIQQKHSQGKEIEIVFVGGADLLASINVPNLWSPEDVQILVSKFHLMALERPGTDLSQEFEKPGLLPYKDKIEIIPQPIVTEISSTKIRKLLSQGHSVKYFIPDGTLKYLQKYNLYPKSD